MNAGIPSSYRRSEKFTRVINRLLAEFLRQLAHPTLRGGAVVEIVLHAAQHIGVGAVEESDTVISRSTVVEWPKMMS